MLVSLFFITEDKHYTSKVLEKTAKQNKGWYYIEVTLSLEMANIAISTEAVLNLQFIADIFQLFHNH